MTYEPYLSAVRDKPDQGHILATTLDYPMVLDTLGCTPKFLDGNPAAAKALVDGYFDALDAIKADPKKADEIMGADVKQTGEEFADSAKYLRWVSREDNKSFFAKDFVPFTTTASNLLRRHRHHLVEARPEGSLRPAPARPAVSRAAPLI